MAKRHERCYSRFQEILNLEHYLEPLDRKPGALAGRKQLEQWRSQGGRWPASYDRIWEQLTSSNGKQNGTRQMIELLQLGKVQGYDTLRQAVESALEWAAANLHGALSHDGQATRP